MALSKKADAAKKAKATSVATPKAKEGSYNSSSGLSSKNSHGGEESS